MYIVNTKKELLGTNKFTASSKIKTKEDFRNALNDVFEEIVFTDEDFMDEYGDDIRESQANYIISSFIAYMNDNELSIPKFDKAAKVIRNIYGVDTCDMDDIASMYYDEDDITKIITIDDKFACMYNLSSVGDDAYCIVASILYFDENMDLNIYVPVYGNTRVPKTDYILGNTGLYDESVYDYIEDLTSKHEFAIDAHLEKRGNIDDLEDEEIDNLKQMYAYMEEFGITEYDDEEWLSESMFSWECDIRPNESYILEDINSNLVLA